MGSSAKRPPHAAGTSIQERLGVPQGSCPGGAQMPRRMTRLSPTAHRLLPPRPTAHRMQHVLDGSGSTTQRVPSHRWITGPRPWPDWYPTAHARVDETMTTPYRLLFGGP